MIRVSTSAEDTVSTASVLAPVMGLGRSSHSRARFGPTFTDGADGIVRPQTMLTVLTQSPAFAVIGGGVLLTELSPAIEVYPVGRWDAE
jgi:hypothetical protein